MDVQEIDTPEVLKFIVVSIYCRIISLTVTLLMKNANVAFLNILSILRGDDAIKS